MQEAPAHLRRPLAGICMGGRTEGAELASIVPELCPPHRVEAGYRDALPRLVSILCWGRVDV